MGTAASAYMRLNGAISGRAQMGERLARRTGARVGGPCGVLITVETLSDLHTVLQVLAEEGVAWVVMGKGSSMLVSDAGYTGAVIILGREFTRVSIDDEGFVHAGAAVLLPRLVNEAFDKGLTGLECIVGLPGTVGGAVSTNAGDVRDRLGASIVEVVSCHPTEGLVRHAAEEIDWLIGCSTLPSDEVILEVTLKLSAAVDERNMREVRLILDGLLAQRRDSFPLSQATCGPVFMHTPDTNPSELAAACGLAGQSFGDAQIYEHNPNFIINLNRATAQNYCDAIARVIDEVGERYGSQLTTHVKFLGF